MISRLLNEDNLRIIPILSLVGISFVIIGWLLTVSSNVNHFENLLEYGVASTNWEILKIDIIKNSPKKPKLYIELAIRYEIEDKSNLETIISLNSNDAKKYLQYINTYNDRLRLEKEQRLLYLPSKPEKIMFLPYQKKERNKYLLGNILFYTGIVLTIIGLIVTFGIRVFLRNNSKS